MSEEQVKIISVEYDNILYGNFFISNKKINDTSTESTNFNKEEDIHITDNNNIYLKENCSYYISFKTCEKFENEEIFSNIPEEVIVKENYIENNGMTVKNLKIRYENYVGKATIQIKYKDNIIFNLKLEIRSSKMDYEDDYKQMIKDLSQFNNGLLYSINSPVYQLFEMNDEQKENMKYQYYMYLEYLFSKENLPFTYNYLIRNMNSKLEIIKQNMPVQLASNIDTSNITSYLTSDNIQHNTVYPHLPEYVPLRVNNIRHVNTIDTPENQFFKYFLELVNNVINELLELFQKGYPNERLTVFKHMTNEYLSNIKLSEISKLDYLPLNSQVLQKKEGYKEILNYYFKLENTYNVIWEDINELIKGDEKKIYELYERWCYFQLIEILREISGDEINYKDVFTLKEKSQTYDIQTGFNHEIKFNCKNKFNKDVTLELWYNKQFNSSKENKEYTSYSVNLRPDYTIKIDYDDNYKLIHFDAKYKKELSTSEEDNGKIDHTQVDIAKMHAYFDGIRNSIGAYILYPGENPDLYKKYENDFIPTIGSFTLMPNDTESVNFLKMKIEEFLKKIIS